MPMNAVMEATPYYVLMNGKRRIGPKLAPLDEGIECTAVYGFSDKDPYDNYCRNSHIALTPYPLVKGYLRNQVNEADDRLNLVVMDAAGPREPYLHTATMEAVLDAHENRMSHVTAAYRLVFDQQAEVYRVEEVSM